MTTAILYIRVSTDEQALKGYSLHVQEERLQRFCVANNIVVLKVVKEDHSARTFDRPAWKNFIREVKRPKKPSPCLILFTKWDRFSRNIADSYYMIRLLKDLQIEPQAIEQPLDLSVPENKILLAVYIATSEVENDRRSLNVRQGIHKARQDGKWTSRVPLGYTCQLMKRGVKLIVPKEPEASLIRNAYRIIVSNHHSDIQSVYNGLVNSGLKCSRSHFWRIIRNPFYSGKIVVPKFEETNSYLVKGDHEAIIPEILFNKVQRILNSEKRKTIARLKSDEKLPLRGLMLCPNCKGRLTGSKSKGKISYYAYYHCHHCGVFRVRADKANHLVENELNKLVADAAYQKIYSDVLRYVCKEFFEEQIVTQNRAVQSIHKLIERIVKAKELSLKGEIENDDFILIRTDCEKRINGMGLELQHSTLLKGQNKVQLTRKTLQLTLLGMIWNRYNSIKKRELLTMLLQARPVLQKEFGIDDILNNAARLVLGLKVVNKSAEPNNIFPNNLPEQMTSDMVDKILKHELCMVMICQG
ncbi:recombinase family protein [Pedobacter sp.]